MRCSNATGRPEPSREPFPVPRKAAAGHASDQMPAVRPERHAVAAPHPDETLLVELCGQCLGFVLVDTHPIGNGRDRGPALRIVADLLVQGAAVEATVEPPVLCS